MTKSDIDHFIDELKNKKNHLVRQKGDKKSPSKEFNYRHSGLSCTPSAEVECGKRTDLYEFENNFSTSKLSELITKWIMFSIRARALSGKFFLVVNKKDKLKFSKVIREKSLDIELIVITNVIE